MPAVAKEVLGRQADQTITIDGNFENKSRPWFVREAASEAEAIAAVAAEAPSDIDGLPLVNIRIAEQLVDGYECEANYSSVKPSFPSVPLEVGQSSFSFEVATQSQRVISPVKPQLLYPHPDTKDFAIRGSSYTDSRLLIGKQRNDDPPEGVEVTEPIASFSETHIFGAGVITAAMQRVLLRVVAHTNRWSFRGWEPGEVLCTGISGNQRGGGPWEVSFRFSVRENQYGITICEIPGINKQGWQYLWPLYQSVADNEVFRLTSKVTHMVVADVYNDADYGVLGIGF